MGGLGSADEVDIIINTAIEMLITGCDLFVNKNDFTPGKVNAKESNNFLRNDTIMGQTVDLSWISKKGFRLGVIFYGAGRNIKISKNFHPDTNTFIAKFDIAGVHASITNNNKNIEPDTIREVLCVKNDFSAWLYWPQFPSKNHQQKPPLMSADELAVAYDQWCQSSESAWEGMLVDQSSLSPVRATYKGCKRSKSSGELVYRFHVVHEGKEDIYHLISYDSRLYLLDYTYDSVPLSHPKHSEISDACARVLPLNKR